MHDLVDDHGDQDRAAEDRVGPIRVGLPILHSENDDAVFDHHHDARADDDAEDGPLSAAQRAPTEHGRRDGIELVRDAHRLRHLPDIWRVTDRRDPRQAGGNHVRRRFHALHPDARIRCRITIAANRVEIAPKDREMQQVSGDQRNRQKYKCRILNDGQMRNARVRQMGKGDIRQIDIAPFNDGLRDAAQRKHGPEGDDERLKLQLGDEQALHEPDQHGNPQSSADAGVNVPVVPPVFDRNAEVGNEHADQPHHGSNRQIDPARNNDKRAADGEDRQLRDLADVVDDIILAGKRVVLRAEIKNGAHCHQRHEHAEFPSHCLSLPLLKRFACRS